MEVSEAALKVKHRFLKNVLAEAQEKLLSETQWQQKYNTAVLHKDILEKEQKKLNGDIQTFQDLLKSQGEFKKSYETAEAAKKTLTSENKTLQKKMNGLQFMCPIDELLRGKITAVQNPNGDLGHQVQENQDQINGLNLKNITLRDELL